MFELVLFKSGGFLKGSDACPKSSGNSSHFENYPYSV